jgi:hypothetical protein
MVKNAWQKGDIYIDCQPVNSEGDSLVGFDVVQHGLKSDTVEKSGDKFDVSGVLSNPLVGIIVGGIGLYAIVKVAQLGIGALSSNNKK